MIQEDLISLGITDERVIEAIRRVPREEFLPDDLKPHAYDDNPLPIGKGQTISQPYVVALACQLLELSPAAKVLDVGTGSGYQAAVLSFLAEEVWTIECIASLAKNAEKTIKQLGYKNIHVVIGDGSLGYPAQAPFDGIVSAASSHEVPKPWLDQLTDGGRLVAPIGGLIQELVRVMRIGNEFKRESFGGVRYVPLVRG